MASEPTKTDTTASSTTSKKLCSSVGCNKEASSLKCPICVKLNLENSYFCSQECFKLNYKEHNYNIHKLEKERIEREKGLKNFIVPKFNYTGKLRPSYVTPMRKVPNSIKQPDYASNGVPLSEMRINKEKPKYIPIYNSTEIDGIRKACKIGREVLDFAGKLVKIGITTEEIDFKVHEFCIEKKCYPSPLNYHSFPKSCCTSVNEVVCHGIPDCRPLEDGDIINIDITVFKDGFHGDLNETFLVGNNVKPEIKNLVKVSYESMMNAIHAVKPNVMCRQFGNIIENTVKKHGFGVVRTYCGHGIGSLFHCNPNIPHYKKNKAIGKLKPGMIFTIEPMINMGNWKDKTWTFDGWTSVTIDGKPSAQFEHTLLVTRDGYEILTERTADSNPFWWDVEAKNNEERKENNNNNNNNNNNDVNTNNDSNDKNNDNEKQNRSNNNENNENNNNNDSNDQKDENANK